MLAFVLNKCGTSVLYCFIVLSTLSVRHMVGPRGSRAGSKLGVRLYISSVSTL